MAFKVTYTPSGKRPRDLITGVQSADRAEKHREAYAKQASKGDSVNVVKDDK